jgi:maltose alpha-D-glucosyltransferase/alpha-amylase
MQLYDLGNDRRRMELAFSLLFGLPGTPMMQYGDEIGMGENLRLPERESARTPMQWTAGRNGGFSRSKHPVRPVLNDPVYGFTKVNVADQQRDPESFLNWTARMIRMRRECPEISWGDFVVLRTNAPEALALRYDWRQTSLVTLHNFSGHTKRVQLRVNAPREELLVNLFNGRHSRMRNDGRHHITLEPYAWRWFRVGGADNTLDRSELNLTDDTVR